MHWQAPETKTKTKTKTRNMTMKRFVIAKISGTRLLGATAPPLVAAALTVVIAAAARAPAQWASLHSPPGMYAHAEGFHALAQSSTGSLHAFSAMAVGWLELGAPHAGAYRTPPVHSGDWTALVRRSPSEYRAYSARLHRYADIQFTNHPDQIHICVEDDVILMIGNRVGGGGTTEACAYSAQTNAWAFQPLPAPHVSAACSRFVAGVIGPDLQAHGFSARHGRWVGTPCGSSAVLIADGNVLLVDNPPPTAVQAFSGVLGQWSASPLQYAGTSARIDHNVAFMRAASTDPAGVPCAYSAYAGSWITADPPHLAGPVHLTDNTVIVERPAALRRPSFRAFGARPGAWASLDLVSASTYTLVSGGDWAVVDDRSSATLHAFSGVCGAAWRAQRYTAPITIAAGPSGIARGRDGAGRVRAFSAPLAAWAAPLAMPSGTLFTGSCYMVASDASTRAGYSARRNVWVTGPAKDPGAAHSFGFGGSIGVERNDSTGELAYWHERRSAWVTGALPGVGRPSYRARGNVVLIDATSFGGPLLGLSAQRGDAIPAAGVAGAILEIAVEDNVAWARDAAGVLHAFGTPDATHSFFQYPLDSELQVVHPAGSTPVPSKTVLRGEPGHGAAVLFGLAPLEPPLVLPGIGTLLVDIVTGPHVIVAAGALGTDGLLSAPLQLPLSGPPMCVELYLQGLTTGPSGVRLLGNSAEPARYH
jgi:hypothetical protein